MFTEVRAARFAECQDAAHQPAEVMRRGIAHQLGQLLLGVRPEQPQQFAELLGDVTVAADGGATLEGRPGLPCRQGQQRERSGADARVRCGTGVARKRMRSPVLETSTGPTPVISTAMLLPARATARACARSERGRERFRIFSKLASNINEKPVASQRTSAGVHYQYPHSPSEQPVDPLPGPATAALSPFAADPGAALRRIDVRVARPAATRLQLEYELVG
ncbi:MAG: hypothetical protein WDM77_06865 [Steroidobacteraceae bacterium]